MKGRMKKLLNRVLASILTAVMVAGSLPANTVFAAESDTSSLTTTQIATRTNAGDIKSYAEKLVADNIGTAESTGSKTAFTWETEGAKRNHWTYYNGVMVDSFLRMDESGITTIGAEFAQTFYGTHRLGSDGTITTYQSGEVDSVPAALGIFDLLDSAEQDDLTRYKAAIQTVYDELEKLSLLENCGDNFQHKSSWTDYVFALDGIYMASPFVIECANAIKDEKLSLVPTTGNVEGIAKSEIGDTVSAARLYTATYDRLNWVATNMLDESTGLYYHGVKSDGTTMNGHFWLRGIGWYAVALADIIEMMPDDYPISDGVTTTTYKEQLKANLKTLFDGMLEYQDLSENSANFSDGSNVTDTGMWFNIVNTTAAVSDTNSNRTETSGTAMMAYALMKAYNNGWYDSTYSTTIGKAGLAAFNGLVNNKYSNGSVKDIYKQSGVETSDDGYCRYAYLPDEAKGTGILIQAALIAEETAAKLEGKTFENYSELTLVTEKEITLDIGKETTVSALLKVNGFTVDAGSQNILWESDNAEIATVDNGKIFACSAGTANITATVLDNTNSIAPGEAVSETIKVTVALAAGEEVYTVDGTIPAAPAETEWQRYTGTIATGDYKIAGGMEGSVNELTSDGTSAAGTVASDVLTSDNATVWTVGGTEGAYTIKVKGDGTADYLQAGTKGSGSADLLGDGISVEAGEVSTTYVYNPTTNTNDFTQMGFTTSKNWKLTEGLNVSVDVDGDGNEESFTSAYESDGSGQTITIIPNVSGTFKVVLNGKFRFILNGDKGSNETYSSPTLIETSYTYSDANAEFVIDSRNDAGRIYYISFTPETTEPTEATTVSKDWIISEPAETNGGYSISTTVDGTTYYLNETDGTWSASTTTDRVYFYKEVETSAAVPEQTVNFAAGSASAVTLEKDKTSAIGYTVTVDGKAVDDSACTIEWTSVDETVASVDTNGNVTALKAGSTYITGTLTAVNGNALAAPIAIKIPVTVTDSTTPSASPEATEAPTAEPTETPSAEPTEAPTTEPTEAPTTEPTETPSAGTYIYARETADVANLSQTEPYIIVSEYKKLFAFAGILDTVSPEVASADGFKAALADGVDPAKVEWYLEAVSGSTDKYYLKNAKDQYVCTASAEALEVSADGTKTEFTIEGVAKDEGGASYKCYNLTFDLTSTNTGNVMQTESTGKWKDANSSPHELRFYKKTEIRDLSFELTLSPEEITEIFAGGASVTVTPTVTATDPAKPEDTVNVDSYKLTWTTSDSKIADVDANGVVTGQSAGAATITVSIAEVVVDGITYVPTGSGATKTVAVNVVNKEVQSYEWLGIKDLTIKQGSTPKYSNLSLKLTYTDGAEETIPFDDKRLTYTAIDTSVLGTYKVTVKYSDTVFATFNVTVSDDPYIGLDPATEIPTYPESGAVRMNKYATLVDFNESGLVKLHLNAAGVAETRPVDVVLIVDVSNSMAWSVENGGGKTDADRLPTDGQTDKLTDAMTAAADFADALLKKNVEGGTENNTISMVTFAGYDKDNGSEQSYADSVQTSFVGVEDAIVAKSVFTETKFTEKTPNSDGGVKCTIQLPVLKSDGTLDTTSNCGTARGNTNYDYGFWQASQVVKQLKAQEGYDAENRDIVVLFMTDGAPSHFTAYQADGTLDAGDGNRGNGSAKDYVPGTTITYSNLANLSQDNWKTYFTENGNHFATELDKQVSEIYSIGFDLNHGGFDNWSWTAEALEPALESLVNGKTKQVVLADNAAALDEFVLNLAETLVNAGIEARVTDTIYETFTLQTAWSTGVADGKHYELTLQGGPKIEVTSYELISAKDVANSGGTLTSDDIGTRKKDENGKYITEILGDISFSKDGTKAFSSLLEDRGKNILTKLDGVTELTDSSELAGEYMITGKTFVYTKKLVDGAYVESFEWNLGDIVDKEVELTYYAYLKGSLEGTREAGEYDTNKEATLEYIDIHNKYVKRYYEVPFVTWGGASVVLEYYLVDESGNLVNGDGLAIDSFANRYIVGQSGRSFSTNSSFAPAISAYVPQGYKLYKAGSSLNVFASDTTGSYEVLGSNSEGEGHVEGTAYVERVDTNGATNTILTKFAIAVVVSDYEAEEKGFEIPEAKIVIDYGKPVNVEDTVLTNASLGNVDFDATKAASDYEGYVPSLVGFTQYDASLDLSYSKDWNSAVDTFRADYGKFDNTADEASYTPNAFVEGIDEIFAVIKYENADAAGGVFYMYEKLSVIPATSVYYEQDFAGADNDLSISGTHTQLTSAGNDKKYQDAPTGNDTYGYDSTYTDDVTYSDGTAWNVTSADDTNKSKVAFSFMGTGCDLISATNKAQGVITVKVTKADGTVVDSRTIWLKTNENVDLKQIPVYSFDSGESAAQVYNVEIQLFAPYTAPDGWEYLGYDSNFIVDAVRIFNPCNNSELSTAAIAYGEDGEATPEVYEVRDLIIKASEFGTVSDGVGSVTIEKNLTDGITETGVTISDFETYGPKNEVYLSKGQGIAFKLSVTADKFANLSSLDIGAKSADGNAVVLKTVLMPIDDTANKEITTNINSCTSMNYDMLGGASAGSYFKLNAETGNYEVNVLIYNDAGTDGILSITDIKLAYGTTVNVASLASFIIDEATMEQISYSLSAVAETETSYRIEHAEFTSDTAKYKKTTTLIVTTPVEVESLDIRLEDGTSQKLKKIKADIIDGKKQWTVSFRPLEIGELTYVITGYGADGTAGTPATATITVTKN